MNVDVPLQVLQDFGLIRPDLSSAESEFVFHHALLQEAAYESLLKTARTDLHRAVGEAMEAAYPDRVELLAPQLGRHFHEAGNEERALRYFVLAADSASRVFAAAEAIGYLRNALELALRTQAPKDDVRSLFEKLGRQYEHKGEYRLAVENYLAMERYGAGLGDASIELASMLLLTNLYCRPSAVHDPEKGVEFAQLTLKRARALGDRSSEAQALWNLVLVKQFSSRFAEAAEYGEKALELARAENMTELIAFILNDLSTTYVILGKPENAEQARKEARELWEASGNLPMLIDNLGYDLVANVLRGNYEEALAASAEMQRLSGEIDNPWGQSYSLYLLNQVYADYGEFGRAFEVGHECIRLAEVAGFIVPQVQTRAELGLFYGILGQPDRGLESVAQALEVAKGWLRGWQAIPLAIQAMLLDMKGLSSEAASALAQSDVDDPSGEFEEVWPDVMFRLLAQAQVSFSQGDASGAIETIHRFLRGMRRVGFRVIVPDGLLLLGRAHRALGDLQAAHDALQEARLSAEAIRSRRALWEILAELSDVEAERGNTDRAEGLRMESRNLVAFMEEHIGAKDLRESFLALPRVRAVMGSA